MTPPLPFVETRVGFAVPRRIRCYCGQPYKIARHDPYCHTWSEWTCSCTCAVAVDYLATHRRLPGDVEHQAVFVVCPACGSTPSTHQADYLGRMLFGGPRPLVRPRWCFRRSS